MALRLKTSDEDFSVAGTVFGANHLRLVDVDGVEVDMIPQGNVARGKNEDTPGIVGKVGTLLGTHGSTSPAWGSAASRAAAARSC